MPHLDPFLTSRRTRAAALLLLVPLWACGDLLPDEETEDTTGGEATGGTETPDDGGTGSDTAGPVDDSGSDGSAGDGSGTDTGEPGDVCDPGCGADELCFEGGCHPMGMSVAFGGGTDRQTIWAVATDTDGSIVIAGDFANNLEIGDMVYPSLGSGRDMFVAKLDPIGGPVWVRTFGSAEVVHQAAKAVAIDADGSVIVGGEIQDAVDFGLGPVQSQGVTDVFVAKLDRDGTTVWAQAWGDTEHQHLEALAVAADGSISLTGDFNGTFDFGGDSLINAGGGPDVFVARLDADGGHVWSLGAGSDGNQHGRALALDAAGDVYVCGEFRGMLSFGGSDLPNDVTDVFVARLAGADGSEVWALSNLDPGDDECDAIAVDADGNVGIMGRFHDTLSFGDADAGLEGASFATGEWFAAKLDTDGALVWSRGFGIGDDDTTTDPANAVFDASGNLVLAGSVTVGIDFGGGPLEPPQQSIFLATLDAEGSHVASALFGDQNRHVATAVTVDAFDNVLVVGEFTGMLDFGFGVHTVQANPDAFVARIP